MNQRHTDFNTLTVFCPQGPVSMELSPPPSGLEAEHETLFTADSLLFLHELISTFNEEVDEVGRLNIALFNECTEDLSESA